jgi:hypothetical protein
MIDCQVRPAGRAGYRPERPKSGTNLGYMHQRYPPTVAVMTWRTRTPILIFVSALALAGCAQRSGGTPTTPPSSGQGGFGEVNGQTASPTPDAGSTPDNGPTTSGGNHGGGTSPSPTRTGPQIVTFTARNAVCPVDPKPDAPYSSPGQVTVAWKISGADTVDLAMDGGLWRSYPGQQGTDTLPFQCDNSKLQTVTHTFTLTIKNTGVAKTVSASAKTNPN